MGTLGVGVAAGPQPPPANELIVFIVVIVLVTTRILVVVWVIKRVDVLTDVARTTLVVGWTS